MSVFLYKLQLIGLILGFFGQYFIITEITRYREDGRPEVRDFSNYPKKFRNYKIVKFIAVLSISIGFFLQAISVYALLASI